MDIADSVFGAVLVAILVFALLLTTSHFMTLKEVVITSHVMNIEYHTDYMIVHFKNGESYKTEYNNEVIDFDESKNVTIKLQYSNNFWLENTNNVWIIMNIIKY